MPKTVETSLNPITSSALGEITVTSSPTDVDDHVNPENFKIVLTETIKRANIFGDDLNSAISINANIFRASIPGWGGSKEGDLGVHYIMLNKDKKIMFEDDVYYKGTSDAFESFFGSQRALLAFQRTNQGHMDLLLAKVRTALSKNSK